MYDESLLVPAEEGPGGSATAGGSGGEDSGGNTEGGTSGSSGDASGTGGSCSLARAPERPPDDSYTDPDGTVDFIMVMNRIDLGDAPPNSENPPTRFNTIGLDIDGLCDPPEATDCVLPDWSVGTPDGPGGIDNAMGAVAQAVRSRIGDFSSENYTERLLSGGTNVIFRVQNYNDEDNDPEVTLSTYIAAPFNSFDSAAVPAHDGADTWPIASDSLVDDTDRDSPRFNDPNAYVTNNQLVGTLFESSLRIDVGLGVLGGVTLAIKLTRTVVVCNLERVPLGSGWGASSCTLAGRWETDDLLHQLSQFPDPGLTPQNVPLCTDSGSYPDFKRAVCQVTDALAVELGTTQDCDALSIGVEFGLEPALLGNIWPLDDIVSRCPEPFNPACDSCTLEAIRGDGCAP